MRFLSIVLIFCLVASNVASAAMLCCTEMDQQHIEQVADTEMPCHGSNHDGGQDTVDMDAEHDCECQNCVQSGNLIDQRTEIRISKSSTQIFHHDGFISPDLHLIYHPPKQIA